jgi:hypothetical protein
MGMNLSGDWLAQAERDLLQAESSRQIQSRDAISYAGEIIAFARTQMA